MKTKISILIVAILCSFANNLYASKEGILINSKIDIESIGIGESGPIIVSGTQGPGGINNIDVKAFNKIFKVNKDKLAKLKDFNYNGIQISYEHGYRDKQGKTIYIKLIKGFTDREAETHIITIMEQGTIEVR
jgi:hypothetical protein